MTITRPPSNIVACRNADLIWLCDRMRPDEIEQYLALTFAEKWDPEVAARGFMNTGGMKFTVLQNDGLPAAAGGYEEVQPGVWQSWMVGTPEGWAEQWRSLTKATRWLMDGLIEQGARRLQTTALASRECAIEWYERSLRMTREGTMRGYGRQGEDVAMFARLAEG